MYKEGDIVKVKDASVINDEELNLRFLKEMKRFCGEEYKVVGTDTWKDINIYYLEDAYKNYKGAKLLYAFAEEWLEPGVKSIQQIEENEVIKLFKL